MNFTFTEFDFTLRDGRSVHLRATQPSDEAELLQTFDCMSPDERYMRFMRPMREPDVDHLRKVLASFPESGFGVVATIPAADGIDIVGSCVAIIDADSSSCEFGITVIANYSRTGLGRVLMTALIDTAKKRGLQEMEGLVLATNQPMRRLAASLGFTDTMDPEAPGVQVCHLHLSSA
jgi:acetyltransferase